MRRSACRSMRLLLAFALALVLVASMYGPSSAQSGTSSAKTSHSTAQSGTSSAKTSPSSAQSGTSSAKTSPSSAQSGASSAKTSANHGSASAKQKDPQESPYEFTKSINWVRPESKTYTLYDHLEKPAAEESDKSVGKSSSSSASATSKTSTASKNTTASSASTATKTSTASTASKISTTSSRHAVNKDMVRRVVLPNGLRVLVEEIPYDDVVAIELLVKCGVFQEETNFSGYTNCLMDIMLNRVTIGDNGEDVAEITGSVIDAGLTPDVARLSIVTSSEYSQYWIDRLCAALSNPKFSESEVEKVRSRLIAELEARGGHFTQIYEVFLSLFYRYHPYKRSGIGSKLVLGKATPESLEEFYSSHFSSEKMVIVASGKLHSDQLVQTVRQKLAALSPRPETVITTQWEAQAQEKETYLSSSASMAWVMVGYPAPPMYSADYAAMRVATSALGSGLSSRLWLELREKRGLAYELSGRYPDLSGPSHFLCHAVCNATSTGEVRRRMKSEVENFVKDGIGSQELEDTRNMLIGDYLMKRETNAGKALHLGMAELLGPGYGADERMLDDLKRVNVSDVNRVARKYLREPCVIVARPGGRLYFE